MASLSNPKYSVALVHQSSTEKSTSTQVTTTTTTTKYELTGALTSLTLDEPENGIAQKVSIRLAQATYEGTDIVKLINEHDIIYVYADTGDGPVEVFRGYIWTKKYSMSDEKEITLTCYDHLIYLQESEEYQYFSSGKSTSAIFSTLCGNKGIPLKYNYESITHGKVVIRGTLADAFTTDLIDNVRKKKGKRGVIRATKGTMEVFTEGTPNKTVYKFTKGKDGNIIKSEHEITLDGITTKVIILGSEKDDKAAPIKATVTGKTSKYGTIQKIISSTDSDKLATLKEEANQIIKDNGDPKKYVTVSAVDNPWVRKGDLIYLDDGYVKGNGVVKGVSHDGLKKVMSMEVRM